MSRSDRPATVKALCDWAEARALEIYRKPTPGRRPTREHYNIRDALRPLRQVAGDRDPNSLRAEDLCECQGLMVQAGLSRKTINDRINRIRRVVRWATKPPNRWIDAAVLADLSLVDPLAKGRSAAPDHPPVQPVSWETVSATIAAADLELATAIELQWHTGMRPGELVRMQRQELTRQGELTIYRPAEHKTQHYEVDRVITIGQLGQSVLDAWLRRLPPPPHRPRVFRWSQTDSYRQAIHRLNARKKLADWSPNQIRHAFGTRVRAEAGIDAAQWLMGHRHVSTTEIYAEKNRRAGEDAARRLG